MTKVTDKQEGELHAYASGSGSLSFVIRDEDRNPVSGRRPQANECVAYMKAKIESGQGSWADGRDWVIINQGPLDRENHEHFEAVRKVERVGPNALKMGDHVYEYDLAQVQAHAVPKFKFELAGRTQEIEGTGNNGALGYFLKNEKVLGDPARVVWDSKQERLDLASGQVANLDDQKFTITMRSRATFGVDTDVISVWPGQTVEEVEKRVADGYGATVEDVEAAAKEAKLGPSFVVGQKFEFKVGDPIVGNGYRGSVTEVCSGQLDGMVVVGLPGGSVCLSASYPDCYPAISQGVEVVTEGRYIGQVKEVNQQFVTQNAGHGKLVAHEVHKFSELPPVGETADIQYKGSKAVVAASLDKGKGR